MTWGSTPSWSSPCGFYLEHVKTALLFKQTFWELVKSQLLYLEHALLEISTPGESKSLSLDWKQWELGAKCLWSWSYLRPPTCFVHLNKDLSYDHNFWPIPTQTRFELHKWWVTVISRSLITIFLIFTYPLSWYHNYVSWKGPLEVSLICLKLWPRTKVWPTPDQVSCGFVSVSLEKFQRWRSSGQQFCTALLLESFFLATIFGCCSLLCHIYDV